MLLWLWIGASSPVFCIPLATQVRIAEPGLDQLAATAPRSTRQQVAEQRDDRLLDGDFYSTPAGKRHLFRLAGSMAVHLRSQIQQLEGAQILTAADGPLADYRLDAESRDGLLVFKAPPAERLQQRRDPARLHQALANARRAGAVRSANPVFIDAETGLARLATGEILIRLQPQVDPPGFFGAHWPRVKALPGTREQFILTPPLSTAEEVFAEANRLAADSRVVWAEPNFISQVLKETSDPLFFGQWNLQNNGLNGALPNADINAPGAWTNSTGNAGIVIAVLDDGAELSHPDLRANLFANPGELNNGLDDDGNGYVDDIHGWNFYRNDNDPSPELPEDQHGTTVAGVAVASANNNIGLAGLAYRCQFMPLKVMGGGNWASDSALAEAVYYAAGRTRDGLGTWSGADVICIGLSFPQSSAVDAALSWAAANGRGGKGCPIFAAAGDDASRWRPTRVRLPVGALEGPGSFQFGFEYSKDVSMSDGEDLVKIDNVALLGSDGVTQLASPLGPFGRQDFEGLFPPAGWELSASPDGSLWNSTTNLALAGTRGAASAQSGLIGKNQWTELRTPTLSLSGTEILSFSCYLSSEADYDGLKVWVYDPDGDYVDVLAGPLDAPLLSGNPTISASIHYPANHPSVSAVGASTDCDVLSDYSQSGPELDFVAPSSGGWNDIISTDLTSTNGYAAGDYVYDFGGTSAACPLAASLAGLVLSANPALSASDVRALLRNSCDKIGELTYDVNGRNNSYGYGRLNAERAVAVAEAVTNSPVLISGIIYYPTNYPPIPPSALRVAAMTVNLAGDASKSTETASDGSFTFGVKAPGNFTIAPSLIGATPPGDGISTLDISLVRRHILSIATFDSPYKLLAADVNGSGSISTLDISLMRRLILAMTNSFPTGLWRLVPADYVFPDPLNPWDAPSTRSYVNLLRDHTNQNFVAIKLGDVNNSWSPPVTQPAVAAKSLVTLEETSQRGNARLSGQPLRSPVPSGPEVLFQASSHTAEPGEELEAHITVSNFVQVTSAQFTLVWDPAVLQYEGTLDFGLGGVSEGSFGALDAQNGRLAFSWDDGLGVTLADDSRLFMARFKVIGPSGSISTLALVDSITPCEVGTGFAPALFRSQNGRVTVGLRNAPQSLR